MLLSILDALWTVLWVDGGAGPISARVTTWGWRATLAVSGRRNHRTLSLFGPFTVFSIVLLWILMLWSGWVLVFASDPVSVLRGPEEAIVDWYGRISFVGYGMFGLGTGAFSPRPGPWELLTALAAGTGVLFITLTVTYILSVISAVVGKRAFASQVAGLGRTSQELVRHAWNGRDFRSLDLPLSALSAQLGTLTEQYLSYPVLQYYHAARSAKSPSVALAVLDEALTVLRFATDERHRPGRAVLEASREAIRSFLDTLEPAFIPAADDDPPPPDLSDLRRSDIPLADETQLETALVELRDRRRKLLGLVRKNGWHWPGELD